MRSNLILPTGLTVSLALLMAACQKPAAETAAAATVAAADAPAKVADPGGAVSPPQANGAVNADANTTVQDVAPASTSFTDGQAKGHIENAGYTEVVKLQKTADGMWTAAAKKNGKPVNVTVDFKGAVTAN